MSVWTGCNYLNGCCQICQKTSSSKEACTSRGLNWHLGAKSLLWTSRSSNSSVLVILHMILVLLAKHKDISTNVGIYPFAACHDISWHKLLFFRGWSKIHLNVSLNMEKVKVTYTDWIGITMIILLLLTLLQKKVQAFESMVINTDFDVWNECTVKSWGWMSLWPCLSERKWHLS